MILNSRRIRPASNERGMTLIEMLIVIALIALVGTIVTQNVMRKFDESKVQATRIQIKSLATIMEDFRRVCGFYPTTEQGLDALIKPPQGGKECKNYDPEGFIHEKRVPKDAWDNDFQYISDGNKFTIRSLGLDGKEGGDGFDKDISSED